MSDLEHYKRIIEDPWAFARECVWTLDPKDPENPIKRFPQEKYIQLYYQLLKQKKKIAVPKSRQMFMSWATIAYGVHLAAWKIGRNIGVVSKKEEDADKLLERQKFILEHIRDEDLPKEFIPEWKKTYCNIEFPKNYSMIRAFPSGADQLRSEAFSLLIFDEMAFWDDAEAAFASAMPTIEGGGQVIAISSAAPGFFKRLVHDELETEGDLSTQSKQILKPTPGIKIWQNPRNRFWCFEAHYSANEKKAANISDVKNSMTSEKFLQEYEIRWDSYFGKPVYNDFDSQVHVNNELIAEKGLPLLLGVDFGLCYDDETEVLTENGWKLFRDVDEKTEKVAVLEPDSFEMKYEIPKLKVDMQYEGEMIVWDNQSLQACITPDHIVPVWGIESKQLSKMYAKDLMGSGHKAIRMTVSKWNGSNKKNNLNLPHKLYCALMGAYLSEGCVDKAYNRVGIYQTKDKGWILDIVNSTPWNWHKREKLVECSDFKLNSYLRQFGTQERRFVPDEVKNSSKEDILEFIRTYTLGDGHIRIRPNGCEEHTVYSQSKRMIDDLQELALKVGWTSSVSYIEPTSSYYEKEDRWIESTGGWNIRFKKTTDWSHLREAKKYKIQYSGRVYCLSVSTGIICVRKNGRPHWNGNTPACVVAQLQGEKLCILREYVAKNMGIRRFMGEVVVPSLKNDYVFWNDFKKDFLMFIDPAGLQKSQTDESTCAEELIKLGFSPNPGPILWEERKQGVEHFLIGFNKQGPLFQVNENRCPTLVQGFKGGYQYPEKALEIEPLKARPIKNEFSHPHDALQYIASRMRTGYKKHAAKIPGVSYSFMNNKASAPS